MDAIKKKMQSLKSDTENSLSRSNELDTEARNANTKADKTEEYLRELQKKIQHVENDLDTAIEKLGVTLIKLDEKDKAFQLAEGESQAQTRKQTLMEDEFHRVETKLASTTSALSIASNRADTINHAIKILETKNMIDEDRIDISESHLKEAKLMVEECDIKYDEVARKLAMVEGDFQRAEERAQAGESKIVELEEELRVIGENLKSLEVAEEKAQWREEEHKKSIKNLTDRLKSAEARAEHGEKTVQKLNLRIDSIMFDVVTEKAKTQHVNNELDQTFQLFVRI